MALDPKVMEKALREFLRVRTREGIVVELAVVDFYDYFGVVRAGCVETDIACRECVDRCAEIFGMKKNCAKIVIRGAGPRLYLSMQDFKCVKKFVDCVHTCLGTRAPLQIHHHPHIWVHTWLEPFVVEVEHGKNLTMFLAMTPLALARDEAKELINELKRGNHR